MQPATRGGSRRLIDRFVERRGLAPSDCGLTASERNTTQINAALSLGLSPRTTSPALRSNPLESTPAVVCANLGGTWDGASCLNAGFQNAPERCIELGGSWNASDETCSGATRCMVAGLCSPCVFPDNSSCTPRTIIEQNCANTDSQVTQWNTGLDQSRESITYTEGSCKLYAEKCLDQNSTFRLCPAYETNCMLAVASANMNAALCSAVPFPFPVPVACEGGRFLVANSAEFGCELVEDRSFDSCCSRPGAKCPNQCVVSCPTAQCPFQGFRTCAGNRYQECTSTDDCSSSLYDLGPCSTM